MLGGRFLDLLQSRPVNALKRFALRLCSQDRIWPPIEYELEKARSLGLLKGIVLNAGAGRRTIAHLIDGTLLNQDLPWENEQRTHIDIFGPIHVIPRPDGFFDTILCIAVLQQVENPEEIIPEFFRVLKPGGHVVASVPFLQPESRFPTDCQRYTQDGLRRLFSHHGFEVVSVEPLLTVYHTLHWLVYEWLQLRTTVLYKMLRLALLPPLSYMARHSRLQSAKLASGFQIIARKPAPIS